MKQKLILLSVFVLFVVMITVPVYAEEEKEECKFTSYIQKTWVVFGERPWVTGFVYNCDEGIQNYLKDFVHWQIKDINGDILTENWKYAKNSASNESKIKKNQPSKYKGIDDVFRGYGVAGANADTTGKETFYLYKNQYFFYLPQIHSIEFEHRGIYQIELTYGNHVETILFATLDPLKNWYDHEPRYSQSWN